MPGFHRIGVDNRRYRVCRIVEAIDELERTDTKETE